MNKISKSILVINTPESCRKCALRYDSYGEFDICAGKDLIVDDFVESNKRPEWCPLSSLPQYKNTIQYNQRGDAKSIIHAMLSMRDTGYNQCLDDILKGENE